MWIIVGPASSNDMCTNVVRNNIVCSMCIVVLVATLRLVDYIGFSSLRLHALVGSQMMWLLQCIHFHSSEL